MNQKLLSYKKNCLNIKKVFLIFKEHRSLEHLLLIEQEYGKYFNRKIWKKIYKSSLLNYNFDISEYCENKFPFLKNDFQKLIDSNTDIISWDNESIYNYEIRGFNFINNLNFYGKILKNYYVFQKNNELFKEDQMFNILEELKNQFKQNPYGLINANMESIMPRHKLLFKELQFAAILYNDLENKIPNKIIKKKKKI